MRCRQTHRVSVDNLSDGDVDDRFGDSDQVRVLIHVELIFKRGNVTRRQEESSVMEEGTIKSEEPRKKKLHIFIKN